MQELKIRVSKGYSVHLGQDLLKGKKIIETCEKIAKNWALVTDENVLPLYAKPLADRLRAAGLTVEIISFPAGDENKTRKTKALIENQMLEAGLGGDCAVLAVGGGVVTDMAGFVAATYARGIPVIYVPTTLLAMVDASIGGKTGVNTPHGKNLIGAIAHPKTVFADMGTLKTLDDKEIAGGLVEAIKHALLDSEEHINLIANNISDILARRNSKLETVIIRSLEVKRKIVEQDEHDKNLRKLLNLGHTLGHGIEKVSCYKISHGAAVALGLLGESKIAVKMGLLDEWVFEKIKALIDVLLPYLPHDLTGIDPRQVQDSLSLDKKATGGRPRFVFLEGIGKPHIPDGQAANEADDRALAAGLDYLFSRFASSC